MASDKVTPIMYADDTTLLSTLDDFNGNQITNPNSIQINAELTKVMDWLTVNKLSLTHSSGVLLGLPTLLHFFLSLGTVIASL